MFFFELIMILIVICTFAYWFGSAIIAALGSFFGTAIAIAILILSMPITLLLTRKDKKIAMIYTTVFRPSRKKAMITFWNVPLPSNWMNQGIRLAPR